MKDNVQIVNVTLMKELLKLIVGQSPSQLHLLDDVLWVQEEEAITANNESYGFSQATRFLSRSTNHLLCLYVDYNRFSVSS